ncbi:ATP-binding cassette domain-containing protein [Echinicola sediminis]
MNKLSPYQRLWRLLQNYRLEIRHIYVYAVFVGLVNLSLPLGIQAIINFLQMGEISTSWFILVTIVLGGITIAGVLQVMQLRIVENIQQDIFGRAAFDFAFRFPNIFQDELDDIHAPELANRFFDTLTLQKTLPKVLIDLSLATFQIFFGMVLLGIYSLYFILIGLVLVVALYVLVRITGKIGLETSLQESKYKYKLAHWLEEIGRVRRSFRLSQPSIFHLDKSDNITYDYIKARESHFQVLIKQFKSFIGFKVFMAAGILVLGSLLVFNQQLNIGQFVAAEIVIILIINSVEKLLRVWDNVYDTLTAFDKIGFVLDLKLEEDRGQKEMTPHTTSSLHLEKVHFNHKGRPTPIFKDLNLSIPAGERVIITGQTGSGKSTLLQLLAGIYHPTEGKIYLNDLPYDQYNKQSLYGNLGMVLSINQIFEGTLRENITMGREISDEVLAESIKALGLEEYVQNLSHGLDHLLDSGGRRTPRCITQKIHLARAICHRPGLLLMEDPLANIPHEEQESIINYLTDKQQPWTLVVITDGEYWLKNSSMTLTL